MSLLLFGGRKLLQFVATQAIWAFGTSVTRMIRGKGWIHSIIQIALVHLILFFKFSWCNSSYSSIRPCAKLLARQGIESILSPKQKRRPLPSLLSLSFFYVVQVLGGPQQVRVPQGRHEHRGRPRHPPLLRLSHRPRPQGGSWSSEPSSFKYCQCHCHFLL